MSTDRPSGVQRRRRCRSAPNQITRRVPPGSSENLRPDLFRPAQVQRRRCDALFRLPTTPIPPSSAPPPPRPAARLTQPAQPGQGRHDRRLSPHARNSLFVEFVGSGRLPRNRCPIGAKRERNEAHSVLLVVGPSSKRSSCRAITASVLSGVISDSGLLISGSKVRVLDGPPTQSGVSGTPEAPDVRSRPPSASWRLSPSPRRSNSRQAAARDRKSARAERPRALFGYAARCRDPCNARFSRSIAAPSASSLSRPSRAASMKMPASSSMAWFNTVCLS